VRKTHTRVSLFSILTFLLFIVENVQAEETVSDSLEVAIDPIVISVPQSSDGLSLTLSTKDPVQPLPVNDGADFLKIIPGFSVARKGGTSGDPILRGLAGSRTNILLDGMEFAGGCSSRMDPPTAYVFPETYDQVKIIKGPQTVRYGNGNSAGVVLFNRTEMSPSSSQLQSSATLGSWGRRDGIISLKKSLEKINIDAAISHAESKDYHDGDGNSVHSAYQRDNASFILGYNLPEAGSISLDVVASEAEASYADRTVDGSVFDRISTGLTLEKNFSDSWISSFSARAYYSYVDHVMDNYSLRNTSGCGSGMDSMCSVMNVDRDTVGARLQLMANLGDKTEMLVGFDHKQDEHSYRGYMMKSLSVAQSYSNLDRKTDYESHISGLFVEVNSRLSEHVSGKYGLRSDFWGGRRFNSSTAIFIGEDSQLLKSGFARLEFLNPLSGLGFYAGFGLSERPMDYWEATSYKGISDSGAVQITPETTRQIDFGATWSGIKTSTAVSFFASDIDNYILITGSSSSKNISASRYGVELNVKTDITDRWSFSSALSFVQAENDTDKKPLPQTPPLEISLSTEYIDGDWSVGWVTRLADRQSRVAAGEGTIVGLDRSDKTPGFTVSSINASYNLGYDFFIYAGIDNIFDQSYYEHLSRTGAAVTGYSTNTNAAIFEPGRNIWIRLKKDF